MVNATSIKVILLFAAFLVGSVLIDLMAKPEPATIACVITSQGNRVCGVLESMQ